ncbi:MAG: tRNA (adenosine(37)-N6)-threonylcarbamoyltransferase complex ATPase subunit type 1 TsaE [Alphaproteobacteria bacterium]|nr:tRNA (adenosine(37)-N6)-threonylcarbamoyltransferase complex ATPase subunit type 1 TsaE [Alphaproteobacteria bacterium]
MGSVKKRVINEYLFLFMYYESMTLEQLEAQAQMFAIELKARKAPLCILLYGDLGAGKSTFARMLVQALTSKETNVPSPTFTLLQTYETTAGPLTHFDLYRLKSIEDVYDLGFNEYVLSHICVVEWPERLGNDLPTPHIKITLAHDSEHTRTLVIERVGC